MRLLLAILFAMVPAAGQGKPGAVDAAFQRLYSFDFDGADRIVGSHIEANREDHFAYTVRASSLLFRELYRLGILETEFFQDDDRIAANRKLRPDPALRARLFQSLDEADAMADKRLAAAPADATAMFTKALSLGIRSDYLAFIDKRQLVSLTYAKESQLWAARILRMNPEFTDAYLTAGISEYLLGSLPFFVRWFVRFQDVEGDKRIAVSNLEMVAARGKHLGPFARILLTLIDVREGNATRARRRLESLSSEFPENQIFRKELARLANPLKTRK